MQTPEHEQGAAIVFDILEEAIVEDIRRIQMGLPLREIPPHFTTQSAIRRTLRQFTAALSQEGLDAAHVSDRRQWKATRWVARRGAYLVRDGLYISRDKRRKRSRAS